MLTTVTKRTPQTMHSAWIFVLAFCLAVDGRGDISELGNVLCRAKSPDYLFDTLAATCYTIHEEKRTWEDAKTACEKMGAILSRMTKWEFQAALFAKNNAGRLDNNYVGSQRTGGNADTYWLGAKSSKGFLHWTDGTPILRPLWKNSQLGETVLSWFGDRTNCVAVVEGGWERVKCDYVHGYICEHDMGKSIALQMEDRPDTSTTQAASSTANADLTESVSLTAEGRLQTVTTQADLFATTTSETSRTTTSAPDIPTTVPPEDTKGVTQRSTILTRFDIDDVQGLPTPAVQVKTSSLKCSMLCVNKHPPCDIMGYNFKTNQCMCFETDAETIPMEEIHRHEMVYFRLSAILK